MKMDFKNSILILKNSGLGFVDSNMNQAKDSTYLISYSGGCHFARRRGDVLITVDGDVLEGEVLDEVDVNGILTHLINLVTNDDNLVCNQDTSPSSQSAHHCIISLRLSRY